MGNATKWWRQSETEIFELFRSLHRTIFGKDYQWSMVSVRERKFSDKELTQTWLVLHW